MRVELRVPRDPAYVGLVRLVVARAALLTGVTQDRVEDVKIAVAEALATATVWASSDDEMLELRFGAIDAGFEVVVPDLDDPVTAEVSENPDLPDPKLGLTLIEGLTDECSFEPDDGRMRLRFVVAVG